jgi:predicted RNase H-like HicB family nuclease
MSPTLTDRNAMTHPDRNAMTHPVLSETPIRPDVSRVELRGTLVLPAELLDRYIQVALRSAQPRELEAGHWYADLERFPGVWADGDSPDACLQTLAEVLKDWTILKIADRDRDLAVIDGIDWSVLSR